ncbi:MAG TPA: hypothetical protein VGM98_23875 [Schlesneria sp.]
MAGRDDDANPVAVPCLIGDIIQSFTEQKPALYDIIVKTLVAKA